MRSVFVSNPARVDRALHELVRIEKEFPKHLGWIKASAFRLIRDMRPNKERLAEISARGTNCNLVFSSTYKIESEDIMRTYRGLTAFQDGIPKSVPRGAGSDYKRWVEDRRYVRARIATAFRSIAADLKSMPSVDLNLKCVGTGSIMNEALQPNNVLEIRHSFMLYHVAPATIEIPDLPRSGVGGDLSWMPLWQFDTIVRSIAYRSSRLQRILERNKS